MILIGGTFLRARKLESSEALKLSGLLNSSDSVDAYLLGSQRRLRALWSGRGDEIAKLRHRLSDSQREMKQCRIKAESDSSGGACAKTRTGFIASSDSCKRKYSFRGIYRRRSKGGPLG
jgi:hypothetical protein